LKSKTKAREVMIRIRLNDIEKKQVDYTAKHLNVKMSELIRQLIKEKHTEVQGQYPMFPAKKGK